MIFPPDTAKPEDVGVLLKKGHNISTEYKVKVDRIQCTVHDDSSRFFMKNRNFCRQFAHVYAERLLSMRKQLQNAVQEKWGM